MATLKFLAAATVIAGSIASGAPPLDGAEVRLPYAELKRLLDQTVAAPPPREVPAPELLTARLRLSMRGDRPVLDGTFRTTSFSDDLSPVRLIGGDIALESQAPPDARVILREKMLCLLTEKAGSQSLEMKLLPAAGEDGFKLEIAPCPSVIFETGDFGPEWSVSIQSGGREQILGAGQVRPFPVSDGPVTIRMLGGEETRRALQPPEPSTWTWQHQALVIPAGGELAYQVLARASASGGSGVAAIVRLPADARGIEVKGADGVVARRLPPADRSIGLALEWRTRGVLERDVEISYRMPLRPLDPRWTLQVPLGEGENATRSRFVIGASGNLAYAAEGLSGPFPAEGLPPSLGARLKGASCYFLEAAEKADLTVTPVPKVATAEGVVTEAAWLVKIEPDGAMLTEGTMTIAHRGPLAFSFDTPPGMKLLACEVAEKPVAPVDLGGGKLEVALSADGTVCKVHCSYTGRVDALDPVAGTLALALPKTPVFIRALSWFVELPAVYQAETAGNLVRESQPESGSPSRVRLRKNLCRDERPEINVFYQRAGLNR